MDKARKKELQMQYKNRTPEMGVISLRCIATGESFLGASKDIPADLNSVRTKLSANYHPNKKLLALWAQYGEPGFDITVLERLKVTDPAADHTRELEDLREAHLAADPKAEKIWR